MKCAAMQKVSREEKEFLKSLTMRYRELRRSMSHEAAIAQLRKEAEEADVQFDRQNTENNGAVHETGSNDVEE